MVLRSDYTQFSFLFGEITSTQTTSDGIRRQNWGGTKLNTWKEEKETTLFLFASLLYFSFITVCLTNNPLYSRVEGFTAYFDFRKWTHEFNSQFPRRMHVKVFIFKNNRDLKNVYFFGKFSFLFTSMNTHEKENSK